MQDTIQKAKLHTGNSTRIALASCVKSRPKVNIQIISYFCFVCGSTPLELNHVLVQSGASNNIWRESNNKKFDLAWFEPSRTSSSLCCPTQWHLSAKDYPVPHFLSYYIKKNRLAQVGSFYAVFQSPIALLAVFSYQWWWLIMAGS